MKHLRQIFERNVTSDIYHFTNIGNLVHLYETYFNLRTSEEEDWDCWRWTGNKYGRFISFTRNGRPSEGYNVRYGEKVAGEMVNLVRLTLDGKKMGRKYRFEPYDFFGCKAFYNKDENGFYRSGHFEDQREERLFTNKKTIDIYPYLKSVDVLCESGRLGYDLQFILCLIENQELLREKPIRVFFDIDDMISEKNFEIIC